MKLKRFKKFFIEEVENTESFNSFVEDVITNNKIDPKVATQYFADSYDYLKPIFRVLFIPRAEFEKYNGEDLNHKSLSDYIVKLMNPSRIVFFTKSLQGMENFIKYPGLFKLTEESVGVVYMIKPASSIDLAKYSGKNPEVKKRISQTQELLSFDDIKITKIQAIYKFDDNGWQMEQLS